MLNLPCAEEYGCHRPWVSKQRVYRLLAADLFTYVNDGWLIGPTEDLYWE